MKNNVHKLNEDAKDLTCKDNWKRKNHLWTKEECATKCKGKWQLDAWKRENATKIGYYSLWMTKGKEVKGVRLETKWCIKRRMWENEI